MPIDKGIEAREVVLRHLIDTSRHTLQRSKGGVRTTPPVLQSLCLSAFKPCEGRRGGVVVSSQPKSGIARYGLSALPLPPRAPSARSGRGVRFLCVTLLLPSDNAFASFALLA